MSTPRRIQRKRTKGWRMPEGAVYVGRPSRWGNPYRVVTARGDVGVARLNPDGTAQSWLIYGTSLGAAHYWAAKAFNWEALRLASHGDLDRLRGKDLVCWCPLDQPCHADVLLELANPVHGRDEG